jgi:hypothetical protein
MSTYTTSKNYNALFDHIHSGMEAFAIIQANDVDGRMHKGVAYFTGAHWSLCIGIYFGIRCEKKKEFVADCRRLDLQWFKPTAP